MANTTKVGTITLEIPVTQDDVASIMTTALHGGIGYWCHHVEVVDADYKGAHYASEVIARGGAIDLVFDYNEDGELTSERLDLATLLNGLKLYAYARGGIPVDADGIDTGQIDVVQADLIVQYAIFGEIIFS